MNKLDKIIKKFFLKKLIKVGIIGETDGIYYSKCFHGENITIELKEVFEGD